MKYSIEDKNVEAIADSLRKNLHYDGGASVYAMPDMIDVACDIAKTEGYTDGYNDGYEQGKAEGGTDSYYDDFWGAYQENGNRVDYAKAFNSKWWTDQNFDPKYDMIPTNASDMFRNSKITDYKSKVNIDFSQAKSFSSCFNNSPMVEIGVIDMSNATDLQYAIYNCDNLTKIEKVIVTANQNVLESSFKSNDKLETVIFEGVIATSGLNVQSSANLSHESLMSIINCLEDKSADTSGTEWLIKIGSDNIAKLTAEEINIAEVKGWNLE